MFNKLKSTEADFSLLRQYKFLDLMNGNILYLTREIDQIKKIVIRMENSQNLQKQVDEFFEEDKENIPDSEKVPN